MVRSAAAQWDARSGLALYEVPAGQGDIQIGAHSFPAGTTGYAYSPGPNGGGDVFFNTNNVADPNAPDVTVELALHELGHALGLKHPFEGGSTGVTLPSGEDKKSNTVMSYTYDRPNISELGSYDVAAIQYLYGPDVPATAFFPAGYSSDSYLAANPDLLRAFGNNPGAANQHYLLNGMREGRNTVFDAARYLAGNPDLLQAFGTNTAAATSHYVNYGINEGRDPKAWNPYAYLASWPDLQTAFGTNAQAATAHYLNAGKAEGRTITFNPDAYLAVNIDVAAGIGTDPDAVTQHYLNYGKQEGRRTSGFDAQTYMRLNPDIAAWAQGNEAIAVHHWVTYGWKEGRPTIAIPGVNTSTIARAAAPEPVFQGNSELQAAADVPQLQVHGNGMCACCSPLPTLGATSPEQPLVLQYGRQVGGDAIGPYGAAGTNLSLFEDRTLGGLVSGLAYATS